MNLARISFFYLWRRKLATALNVALLAFGVAAVTLLVLTSAQVEDRIHRDARAIDLVVGAKGSPTQIVLSSIYELDVPAGSMAWSTAEALRQHPAVGKAMPMVLGDNYRGFRIVGTTADYVEHYGASVSQGRLWREPFEAVIGADVASRLRPPVGSTFVATHGFAGSAGEAHATLPYRIVGVLGHTGTLIDRLVLTDVASYWAVHARQDEPDEKALLAEPPLDGGRTLTALLIQYAANGAAADFARFVGTFGDLESASPAAETARLFGAVSIGIDLIRGFALVLMLSAALSIFIALYNSINERRYDLAVMRALGATRERIMTLLLFEGVILSLAGAVIGLALGHVFTSLLGFALRQAQHVSVSGLTWHPAELWIVALAVLVGVATALVPAWRAHEIDIAATLARG